MEENIKKMDIKEFRELGYLQELNRRFLHPLGLALEVELKSDGTESLSGIWDYRDDLEGILYDLSNSDQERLDRFAKNEKFIDEEFSNRIKTRLFKLGFGIEPINKDVR